MTANSGRLSRRERIGWIAAGSLFLIGALLRIVDLDSNPPGFWQDEASTGLDAYLLWTTGRDRAGALLPAISRSFGDYPLALYRYLDAPIVGLFGPTVGNERLIAALAGTAMVGVTGIATAKTLGRGVALAAMLSAAFCPTWLHFSRYGSEAILLPLCLIGGFAFFEHGRDPNRRWALWAGAVTLGAAAYTYHAMKLVLPLWVAAFLVYQWPLIRELWTNKQRRHLIGPIAMFAVVIVPALNAALTPQGHARASTVLAWYHFEGVHLVRVILNNYLSYFDLGMLFVRGGPAVAQSIPGLGLWNFIELPSIIVGLVALTRPGPNRRLFAFLAFWFATGPLPGGVTYESENVGRVIAWLPAPQMISGLGIYHICRWALGPVAPLHRARRWGWAIVGLLGVLWLATAVQIAYLNFIKYPRENERDWQFEISRALLCAKGQRRDEVIVVAPQFQASDVFTRYLYAGMRPPSAPEPEYVFGNRSTVQPGEIYVTPTTKPLPIGDVVCEIRNGKGGPAKAYVVRAKRGATPPVTKVEVDGRKGIPNALVPLPRATTAQIPGTTLRPAKTATGSEKPRPPVR